MCASRFESTSQKAAFAPLSSSWSAGTVEAGVRLANAGITVSALPVIDFEQLALLKMMTMEPMSCVTTPSKCTGSLSRQR
jgi:hypothetical protein